MNISIIVTTIPKYHKYLDLVLSTIDYDPFQSEIIVVNDALPPDHIDADGTITVINRESEPRWGAGEARNKGAEIAKGECLLFVDGDDIVLPGAIQKMWEHYELIKSHGEQHIIYGDLIRGDTNKVFEFQRQYRGNDVRLSPIFSHNLPYFCLIPKVHFDAVGGFDPEELVPTHEELILEAKFWVNGIKATKIDAVTYYYRWHYDGRRTLGHDKEIFKKVNEFRHEIFRDWINGVINNSPFEENDMPCGSCGKTPPLFNSNSSSRTTKSLPAVESFEDLYLVYTGNPPTETYDQTMTVTGLEYRFGKNERLRKKKIVDKPVAAIDVNTEIHRDDARALITLRYRNYDAFTTETVFKPKPTPVVESEILESKPEPIAVGGVTITDDAATTDDVESITGYTVAQLAKVDEETLLTNARLWLDEENQRTDREPRKMIITMLETVLANVD